MVDWLRVPSRPRHIFACCWDWSHAHAFPDRRRPTAPAPTEVGLSGQAASVFAGHRRGLKHHGPDDVKLCPSRWRGELVERTGVTNGGVEKAIRNQSIRSRKLSLAHGRPLSPLETSALPVQRPPCSLVGSARPLSGDCRSPEEKPRATQRLSDGKGGRVLGRYRLPLVTVQPNLVTLNLGL